VLASVREMYALSVVTKANYIRGESKEKDASFDRCRGAEQVQSCLVLSIRRGMTYSNDMKTTETTCHKGIVPKRMASAARERGMSAPSDTVLEGSGVLEQQTYRAYIV